MHQSSAGFLPAPAENLFRLAVPSGDESIRIYPHDSIERIF